MSSSSSSSSSASFWYKFFVGAGIPPAAASCYAANFSQHRISDDMLADLNKEYLKDLGVTVLGDVIAILKHIEKTMTQNARKKAFEHPKATPQPPKPASKLSQQSVPSRPDPKTPAPVEVVASPVNIEALVAAVHCPKKKTLYMDSKEVMPEKNGQVVSMTALSFSKALAPNVKSRLQLSNILRPAGAAISNEAHKSPPKRLPQSGGGSSLLKRPERSAKDSTPFDASSDKGAVFSRLGQRMAKEQEAAKYQAVDPVHNKAGGPQGIFRRLGVKSQAMVIDDDEDSPIPLKKPTLEVRPGPKLTTISAGVLSSNSVLPAKEKIVSHGFLAGNSTHSKSLAARLGQKVSGPLTPVASVKPRATVNASALSRLLKRDQ